MATFSDIGLSQPAASTITMKLRTLTLDQNSTTVHQEVLSIGDTDSTANVARVITTSPSTHAGLVTRGVVYQSTQTDLRATVYQSTAADFQATITPVSGSTFNVRPVQSSQTDLRATVYQSSASELLVTAEQSGIYEVTQGSTAATAYFPVRIVNSSGNDWANLGNDYTNASTASSFAGSGMVYDNSSNNTMRFVGVTQPWPVQVRTGTLSLQSVTTFVTSTHSTHRYQIVSSAAGVRHKVYAYFLGSTHTNPSSCTFQSSGLGNNAGTDLWTVNLGSGSSGMTGANMALNPPGFIFATASDEPLTVRIEGGNSTATSTTLVRVSVSYISEA